MKQTIPYVKDSTGKKVHPSEMFLYPATGRRSRADIKFGVVVFSSRGSKLCCRCCTVKTSLDGSIRQAVLHKRRQAIPTVKYKVTLWGTPEAVVHALGEESAKANKRVQEDYA